MAAKKPEVKAIVKPDLEAKEKIEVCSHCGSIPVAGRDALGYYQFYCPVCMRFESMKYPTQLLAVQDWNRSNMKNGNV